MRRPITLKLLQAALTAAVLVNPGTLKAQTSTARHRITTTSQLEELAQSRDDAWKRSAPILRCAPAPLTERPTAAAELGRPRAIPLETAFLDAVRAKRFLADRSPAPLR
jgi:hypothetical protein